MTEIKSIFNYKYFYVQSKLLVLTFCVNRLNETDNRIPQDLIYVPIYPQFAISVILPHVQHTRSRFSSRKHPKFVDA